MCVVFGGGRLCILHHVGWDCSLVFCVVLGGAAALSFFVQYHIMVECASACIFLIVKLALMSQCTKIQINPI